MSKRKRTSATAWFEAQGRRAQSIGLPMDFKRHEHQQWPMWARCAWARGWLYQQPAHKLTESIVQSFEDEAARTGRTLRATVTDILNAPDVEQTP